MKTILVCVVILQKVELGNIVTTHTISYRSDCESEDEITGAAVKYALTQKPGFSIADTSITKIELPPEGLGNEKPTREQIDSACLSYRHHFGLLSEPEKEQLRREAGYWLAAWRKESL